MSKKEEKDLKEIRRMREQDDAIIEDFLDGAAPTKRDKRKYRRAVRRTKKLFRAIDILFALSQNACPYVKKDNVETITVEPNIVYDEALPNTCKLDFYRTKTDEKQPAIILIHGGGFSAGDKKYRKGRSQYLALNGFSVFCVNYGLAPEFNFPDPLNHIIAAANFVYDNAERFNIDTDRIFVGGDSAGGYYAAMMAAFNCSDKLREAFEICPKFKVFGVLLNCGVYDIRTAIEKTHLLSRGVLLSMTGVKPGDLDEYQYRDVFIPIELINKDYPPTFLIYSDDDIFCKGQGDAMIDVLKNNGVYHEYYSAHYHGSNHCFSLTWYGEDAAAANALLLSFAKRLAEDKIKLN